MKIQKLPAEARSKLQSGLIITDAVQCALELVHNSLDAEATGIAVRIDLKSYKIRVIDNGKGIGREDFELVGEKFMTSKYHIHHNLDSSFPTYGFKGQALSSLREICKTLTIESKSADNAPIIMKVFQSNETSAITEIISEKSGTGTTVTVEDFMCTMPIRRKRINEVFDMEEIKRQLQYLAIIHYNVCFTLRNDSKGIILLQTPQAANPLESISNVFGNTVAKSLMPLFYKEKNYDVTGYISLKPQIQTNVQLLYINKRVVTKGVIHKFISRAITKNFGKNILCADSPTAQVLKSLRNSYQNIFIVEIKCPNSHYELFTNVRKITVEFENWKDVLKCLHKAVKKTFNEVLHLDNSLNFQEDDYKSGNEKDKRRGIFGTSVLMNAVKGAAVMRRLPSKKDLRKKRKKRLNKIQDKTCTPQTESNKKHGNEFLTNSSHHNEVSHDSFESPIPRAHFKYSEPNIDDTSKAAFNQSFFEFYEWVKTKLETDKNAFNLYNDFLRFKNRVCDITHPTALAEFKSPVVGGKLKRKKIESPEKLNRKLARRPNKSNCLPSPDDEVGIVTKQQLEIFPSSHLRMKKAVQLRARINSDFPQNLNFGSAKTNRTSKFKKSCYAPKLSERLKQGGLNLSVPSLASSEIQFTNVIKFRNCSESFLQPQSCDIHKDITPEDTLSSTSFIRASHYEDFVSKSAELHRQRSKITVFPLCGTDVIQMDKNVETCNFQNICANSSSNEVTTKKNVSLYEDVELQLNLSKIFVEKKKTVAQISPAASLRQESARLKSSDGPNRVIWKRAIENIEVEQPRTSYLSREMPDSDFGDVSAKGCDNNTQLFCTLNEVITKTPKFGLLDKQCSTSSEFLCGQKSNSDTELQNKGSVSKETQTIAAIIRSDSLTEITDRHTPTDSNSKSENTPPKTSPLEEIQCNILQPIESGFCLTERHDFIPKGLSPPFYNPETDRNFSLSPREKSRIKVTVDNARSDFMAIVKWQDESTGDYLKPVIPDGILKEMRQRAGNNMINFENSVLSASLSYCAVKVHKLLHSFAFTKELLSGVEILGQLDKKFMVAKMKLSTPKKMELIALFDQHAVDERIKLEELIRDYSTSDGKFIASRLNPSIECVLNESDVRVLSDLNEKLLNFGLNIKAINENTVSVHEIPSFLLNRHEKDLKNKKDILLSDVLKALIGNIIDESRETRGVLSKIPKAMHNAFCLEACHKAIKFNRTLSVENMTKMIDKLKSCKLPFQCAHGRPSLIPIIDLEDFQQMMERNESVGMEKLKKFQADRGNK